MRLLFETKAKAYAWLILSCVRGTLDVGIYRVVTFKLLQREICKVRIRRTVKVGNICVGPSK